MSELPKPVNDIITSSHFTHMLTWEPGPGSPPGVCYNVTVRTSTSVSSLPVPPWPPTPNSRNTVSLITKSPLLWCRSFWVNDVKCLYVQTKFSSHSGKCPVVVLTSSLLIKSYKQCKWVRCCGHSQSESLQLILHHVFQNKSFIYIYKGS